MKFEQFMVKDSKVVFNQAIPPKNARRMWQISSSGIK